MVGVPMIRRTRSIFPDMRTLTRDIDSLFTGLGWPTVSQDIWSPTVDVEEDADELILRAELPGMSRDDIQIELEDGVLTIAGEKKYERREETQGLLYERRWGTFARRFTLPRAVDADHIRAHYQDGVLTIHVPKAEEARGRRIPIEGASPAGDGREVDVR